MNCRRLSLEPSFRKTEFVRRFLRALSRINKHRSTSSSSWDIRRRSQRIKIAADASMASAVGSRRAWSRAILYKLRRRALVRKSGFAGTRRKRCTVDRPKQGRANELRRLVPGGKAMDFCCLLDETAHYIKCLATQVEAMRSIADFYSP